MAIVTQANSQSSAAINGQSVDFIAQQVAMMTPGAPDSLIAAQLQNTIRDFYYRSAGWVEYIGPYYIAANQPVIDLNPVDQYAQCHFVLEAFLYPDTTGVYTPKWLRPTPRQRFSTDTGPPTFFSMDRVDRIRLFPTPDLNYGPILGFRMQLMPVLNAARLPSIAVTHHFDALLYGTMLRLARMPNKPWTVKDEGTLREWKMTYSRGIVLAKDNALRGNSPADWAGRFPNYAGSYSQSPNTAGGSTF